MFQRTDRILYCEHVWTSVLSVFAFRVQSVVTFRITCLISFSRLVLHVFSVLSSVRHAYECRSHLFCVVVFIGIIENPCRVKATLLTHSALLTFCLTVQSCAMAVSVGARDGGKVAQEKVSKERRVFTKKDLDTDSEG